MQVMALETTVLALELSLTGSVAPVRRAPTGARELPVDPDTASRFASKCAPFEDDDAHLWWAGAIDGGNDSSGGYGRVQAGRGDDAVITTAHRFAWTLKHGPVPEGLVVRHRCDEPLCVAIGHLELGTPADNNWDVLDRPLRASDLDARGSAGRSRAIRTAVLTHLAHGNVNPASLGAAVRAAMALGDPDRFQLSLWPEEAIAPAISVGRAETA
jgi:HNH endonuclease